MRKRSLLLSTYGAVFWGHTIAAFAPVQLASFSASPCRRHDTTTCSSIVRAADGNQNAGNNSHGGGDEGAEDTIRVKIWRALASGDELSLSELGNAVGERRLGELRSHLVHVERQAKTLRNKSDEWRIRRGLMRPTDIKSGDRMEGVELSMDSDGQLGDISPFAFKTKCRVKMRKGKRNEVFVRLA
mmetsp:Transcript_18980/g.54688  ORF Transcript_18980/g.54688 Transcript_18980/m.54688 type:complete len:186 (-) Transcript_18980:91-648(-)